MHHLIQLRLIGELLLGFLRAVRSGIQRCHQSGVKGLRIVRINAGAVNTGIRLRRNLGAPRSQAVRLIGSGRIGNLGSLDWEGLDRDNGGSRGDAELGKPAFMPRHPERDPGNDEHPRFRHRRYVPGCVRRRGRRQRRRRRRRWRDRSCSCCRDSSLSHRQDLCHPSMDHSRDRRACDPE